VRVVEGQKDWFCGEVSASQTPRGAGTDSWDGCTRTEYGLCFLRAVQRLVRGGDVSGGAHYCKGASGGGFVLLFASMKAAGGNRRERFWGRACAGA